MARRGASFSWTSNPIPGNLKQLGPFVDKAVSTTLSYHESQVESYARVNASWQDQTTNARNGLLAQSGKQGKTHFLVLAHRVPYGIWLEVRFGQKYAIIMPTLQVFGPKIMTTLNDILRKFKG